MSNEFVEDVNGQLSFLVESTSLKEKKSNDSYAVEFIKAKIKSFQSKLDFLTKYKNETDKSILEKLNAALKRDFDEFIISFSKMYETLTLDEILFIQENYSTEYHKLCKLFLEYLYRFVYSEGIGSRLEDSLIIQIENLIEMDQVTFRDAYYREIKTKINDRKKLRVNHYILFRGKNLLQRLDTFITREDFKLATNDLNHDINSLVKNDSLNEIFFKLDSSFLEQEQKGTLCMLLLYYLENCVYSVPGSVSSKVIEKLELFVVYNFSDQFVLSDTQKKTYEKVKVNVSKKLSTYINREVLQLEKNMEDFDKLEKFKASGKYKFIEEGENLDSLPEIISREELKLKLENFLNTVFMLGGNFNKNNLPIFLEKMTHERHEAMLIALEYLKRFIYKYANVENSKILTLEDYIYQEDGLVVSDSSLCLAKSKLLSKTGRRYARESVEKSRKLLQTPPN